MSTMTMPRLRVWVDDRHPIFRRGLVASLVAEEVAVVGESSGFDPSPQIVAPGVLIFEALPGALRRAVAVRGESDLRLVVMVAKVDDDFVGDAVEAGVSAVLLRQEVTPRALHSCLGVVTSGTTAVPSQLVPRLLERAANGGRSSAAGLADRERRVLALLAEGEDTRSIASELAYSERTVKNIVHDLLMKMNCRNRAHAVALATRQGII